MVIHMVQGQMQMLKVKVKVTRLPNLAHSTCISKFTACVCSYTVMNCQQKEHRVRIFSYARRTRGGGYCRLLRQHLWRRRFHSNEEEEMAVGECCQTRTRYNRHGVWIRSKTGEMRQSAGGLCWQIMIFRWDKWAVFVFVMICVIWGTISVTEHITLRCSWLHRVRFARCVFTHRHTCTLLDNVCPLVLSSLCMSLT